MKNKTLVAAVVVLGLAATVGSAYALRDKVVFSDPPGQVVLDFYENWVDHDGNPIVDRMYNESDLVTDEFKAEIDDIIASFDKGGYDPVLCAQDVPSGVKVSNVSVDGSKATVTLKESFGGSDKMIEVAMKKDGFSGWKINNIICQEGQAEADNNTSPAIKDLVGGYIRDNIAELSPVDPVLGGSFHVTSIDFTGPYECMVDYEDGHMAVQAQAEFRIPSAGEVVIEEFEIPEDEQDGDKTANFSETGNLVERNNNWTLVYEAPGSPALTAEIQFGDQSECFDSDNEKIACEPGSWKEGSRVEISGSGSEGSVKVNKLIKKE
jgi:hypothetical protein